MPEKIQKALYGDPDNPMPLGDIALEVYVLESGLHVLTGGGFNRALDIKAHLRNVGQILTKSGLINCISSELASSLNNPIKFVRPKRGGSPAYGYPASVLGDFCSDILSARRNGELSDRHSALAIRCEILSSALVQVGLEALIDEWTGYQEIRDKNTLQKILDKYLGRELAIWAKHFDYEFYEQIFRLRGWKIDGILNKRPSVVGRYTKDFVYERIAPGIMVELERRNPKTEKGHRKARHHQWFSETGIPKLDAHIHAVIALMRAAGNWDQFKRSLQRAFPKINTNLELPFDDEGGVA